MRCLNSLSWPSKLWPPAVACWAVLLILCASLSPLWAQQADNPFDAAGPADNQDDPGFGNEAPPADEPAPAEGAPPDDAEPAAVPNDPAVLAVLESQPETPYEMLRAIRILTDLGHPKLAKPLVTELTQRQLTLEDKAALAGRFHAGILMRLARNADLAGSLGPFIDDVFRSAEAYRRDPKRLAEWAGQLNDPDEAARARAIVALLQAREAAVAPLVTILADPARSSEHERARRVLLQLDDLAIDPLLGVLEAADTALLAKVVEILGELEARQAVAALLYPLVSPASTPELRAAAATALGRISGAVPNPSDAVRLLEYAATRQLKQSRDESGDGPPSEVKWHWNPELGQSVPVGYDRTNQALATAVRLASELYGLDRANPEYRRLYLTALLQAAKFRHGPPNPLPKGPGSEHAIAAQLGADAVEDVLIHAMADGYLPAATAAVEVLGDIGSPRLLAHGGATPSALARAAAHADRRLRFAATGAIMKLAPSEPFAGSSRVTEGLQFFASSYGSPRVLIAHPLSAEGAKLAGLAAALGFDADVATNGRQAYELAIQSPDYDLALVHSALQRPAADELLAQLRRDRRTAMLPVGFLAPLNDLDRVERFARRAERASAFLQPQNEEEMKLTVGDLLAHSGRAYLTNPERKAQALAAIEWLVALSERPTGVFNVRGLEPAILPLVYVPEVAPRAAELLAAIGTDDAQRTFLELADSRIQSLPMRKAAVAALARNIRQHGILLTSDEIRRQYDLYNANAGRDPETHEVLGAVLDVIEHKGAPPEKS